MQAWAIRHKPTGRFMPARMSRSGRGGWSHWCPITPGAQGFEPHPRLMFTQRSAQNALSMWLQGEWRNVTSVPTGYFDDDGGDSELVPSEPLVPRVREDMEIVLFALVEVNYGH